MPLPARLASKASPSTMRSPPQAMSRTRSGAWSMPRAREFPSASRPARVDAEKNRIAHHSAMRFLFGRGGPGSTLGFELLAGVEAAVFALEPRARLAGETIAGCVVVTVAAGVGIT